ncbi:class I SAM-dependent methyltransferase [Faecalicatena contorta]|uniref:Class I SAM-dependent methyltransferase n=1 Tax=Faecalicatena fissicatena TaxID=290055 RepID=A0ABS2EBZ2_9FIRM|nr:cyclopropane-fatty-acyl-phospholipid synthase family protein [Faecalicatena contorta]MBM6684973.1 class I SAM-dependent methyltransferase [Faecalicatena contorta]MBM6710501.1 class I SAM-dependent methyltransferase [Faecalicatena contorta]MBM6739136.1 class I SAM-dependent methyltransferase [Faecalicatena fissicatena]
MKDILVTFLERFTDYPFLVKLNGKEYKIGEGTPEFTVKFNKSIPKTKLLTSTSLALGEAYMDKDLEIEGDLYYALDHFLGQLGKFSTDENALKKIMHSSVSKKNQEKEVTSHYDIGNDFYRLWLDETMSYSCGYFRHPDDTLYQAQVNKVDYILEKLNLKEGMTLLDIGCGWGFLLIEAAKKYKIKGVGITLSHEQCKEFERRIEEEGLQDQLKVELMDYRDLPKSGYTFDRVVSVGMVEHVGRANYQLFNDCVKAVLKDGGTFLLHFISALKEHAGDPWIKKYIFPGGTVPSLREMVSCMAEDDFHIMDIENLRLHYNKTLLCWADNFHRHMEEEKKMFDERFLRMWDLYLNACAATFHNGIIDIHQIVATKGINNDYPMVRWY